MGGLGGGWAAGRGGAGSTAPLHWRRIHYSGGRQAVRHAQTHGGTAAGTDATGQKTCRECGPVRDGSKSEWGYNVNGEDYTKLPVLFECFS